jgi:hypothetical protein
MEPGGRAAPWNYREHRSTGSGLGRGNRRPMRKQRRRANRLPQSGRMTIQLPRDLRDDVLILELEKRGYRVTREREDEWLTLSELAARIGREVNSLSRTIARAGRKPPGLEIERAQRGFGRIVRVRPSQEFLAWLRAGAPPRPTEPPARESPTRTPTASGSNDLRPCRTSHAEKELSGQSQADKCARGRAFESSQ